MWRNYVDKREKKRMDSKVTYKNVLMGEISLNRFFKLKEHGTNVKTEIIAGLTTFFAMAYIIFVNPRLASQATGMDHTAVLVATCLSAAIGCFLTAFLANVPFAQAPGMGLNAFFTYSVCMGMGYTWQQALTIVLLSGILFLIIAVSPIRRKDHFLDSRLSEGGHQRRHRPVHLLHRSAER